MGTLRKLGLVTIVTAAAVAGLVFAAGPTRSQQAQYSYPPLSLSRAQYYQQNPAAFQALLERLPKPTIQAPPANTLAPGQPPVAGAWTTLTNLPGVNLSNPILMTDGTVIAHVSCNAAWWKLTPDSTGSYINGTWTQIASLPSGYTPRFFGSSVLPDGRVIIEGGEYNTGCAADWTKLGAIYNPVTNTWASVTPPSGWAQIGDAAGIVLPNGTYMQTDCCDSPPKAALLNPSTLAWTATGTGKFDVYDEEAMALQQDGTVLTVDAYVFAGCGTGTEDYSPATGKWTSAGNVPNQQSDCNSSFPSDEVGPLVTRPNGSTVSFSGLTTGTAGTAIYGGSSFWYAGANIPSGYTLADAPAAVLPNGNILFAASPGNWTASEQFPTPTHYYEMDLNTNQITQVPDTSWASSTNAYQSSFVVLPTGQILATDIDGTNAIQIYTPAGSYQSSWQPVITSVPSCLAANGTYTLSGTQLNGLTEGSYYGDDNNSSVDFPIVRMVSNVSGQVFYAKTSNMSNRSIAPGTVVSTSFTVPAGAYNGGYMLYAVGVGIPSAGTQITVDNTSCASITAADTHDFDGDGYSDALLRTTSGSVVAEGINGAHATYDISSGQVSTTWSIVGQRDFNGDGIADILWRDGNGDIAIWFMSGGEVQSAAGIGSTGSRWSVVGTGDFDGDGYGDILFEDVNGNLAIWFMKGSQILSAQTIGSISSAYTVVGTGDFNHDGKRDIVFQDTSGDVAVWLMNGAQFLSAALIGTEPAGWSVVGTGDFDGDGTTDILLRNTAGAVGVWFMQNGGISSAVGIGSASPAWSIVETGDFNGDGKSDILFFNASANPNTAFWFMEGATATPVGAGFNLNYPTYSYQFLNAD